MEDNKLLVTIESTDFKPDSEKCVNHKSSVRDPLISLLLRQVKHEAWITRCIKAEPKHVENKYEET